MSRADTVKTILILDALAAECKRLAGHHREQLTSEALAELKEQGTAPTWRLPEVARVSLPTSKQSIAVTDAEALADWVSRTVDPLEVETLTQIRVRPKFLDVLLARLAVVDGKAIDAGTGEIVPGVTVRPGGLPGTLTITAEREIKAGTAAIAAAMLKPQLALLPASEDTNEEWAGGAQ